MTFRGLPKLCEELEVMTMKFEEADKKRGEMKEELSNILTEFAKTKSSLQSAKQRNERLQEEIRVLKNKETERYIFRRAEQRYGERQRLELERAQEDFERSRASFRNEFDEGRKFLEKRELLLTICLSERECRLGQDEQRAKKGQAAYERKMTEDRKRLATEMENFEKAQKKWEEDREMLERNNGKLQSKLVEGYQQLRLDQLAFEERLKCKMEELMDEAKNLTVIEMKQKLKDLIETYVCYCEMYADDPDNLTTETKNFQRKIRLLLIKLENPMPSGDNFVPMLKSWTEGAVLHRIMLLYLHRQGKIIENSIQCADLQDRRDLEQMLSSFNASNALPATSKHVCAVKYSFLNKLQEVGMLSDEPLNSSLTFAFTNQVLPSTSTIDVIRPSPNESDVSGGEVLTVLVLREVDPRPGSVNFNRDNPRARPPRQSANKDNPQFS